MNSRKNRCSAVMVTFDSSSPTHQPPGSCKLEQARDPGLERAIELRPDDHAHPASRLRRSPRSKRACAIRREGAHDPSRGVTHARALSRYAHSGWWSGVAPAPLAESGAGHDVTGSRIALPSNVRAAVRPLRTAPSMVAGQPVCVHAPALTTPGRSVSGPGRWRGGPGRPAKVACGSRLTRDQSSSAGPRRSTMARSHRARRARGLGWRPGRGRRSRRP